MSHFHSARSGGVRLVLGFALLAGVGLLGCDSTGDGVNPASTPPITAPVIDSLDVPTLWVYQSQMMRTLHVNLSLPSDLRDAILNGDVPAPSVSFLLQSASQPGDSQRIALYDDGGGRVLEDVPTFVDSHSGDLVPLDLQYAVRMNASFATTERSFRLTMMAGWPDEANAVTTQALDVAVEPNSPPSIESFSIPDTLASGFDAQTWTAVVDDPDIPGGDRVEGVEMHLLRDDVNVRDLILARGSGRSWTFQAGASFAAALPTAAYLVRLTASDRFDQEAEPFETTVWIENLAPVLSSLVAPDTVYRPAEANSSNEYDMFVDVADDQGQGDIQRVEYSVEDPTGHTSTNEAFVFNDQGQVPDSTAGDGTWSHRFAIPNSVQNFGTYIFTITATDRAGNVSEPITKEIELLDSEGKR